MMTESIYYRHFGGDTAKWGTLQKVIRDDTEDGKSNKKSDKEKEDSLYENARDEGQYILDEKESLKKHMK